jgi:membrane fusion protein, multidrug efflux system
MSEVMSEAATLNDIEMPAPRGAQAHAGTQQGAKRGKIFLILFLVIAIAGAAWGSWWHFVGSRYVSTEDAYVNAEVAQITPRVEGTLETVPVHDTQKVAAGEVLATLDQTDAKIAVAQAEAGLARAKQCHDYPILPRIRRPALSSSASKRCASLAASISNAFAKGWPRCTK